MLTGSAHTCPILSVLVIMLAFVNYAHFSKKGRNYTSTFYFKVCKTILITMQTHLSKNSTSSLIIINSLVITELQKICSDISRCRKRASYARAFSPVEKVLGQFLWGPGLHR